MNSLQGAKGVSAGEDDWTRVFCGRETEMAALKEAWARASDADDPKPQIVALVGESGLGKTRLVQEFYHWLSTEVEGRDLLGYWPDRLERRDDPRAGRHQLRINPDPADCNRFRPFKFLWWGIRVEMGRGCLHSYISRLFDHLDSDLAGERQRDFAGKTGWFAIRTAIKVGQLIPGANIPATIADWLVNGTGILEDIRELRDLGRGEAKREDVEYDAKILRLLEKILKASKAPDSPFGRGMVLVLDDAQNALEDPDFVAFLDRLIGRAVNGGWPLLLLLTHHNDAWEAQAAAHGERQPRLAGMLRRRGEETPGLLREVGLGEVADLAPLFRAAFPGLAEEQLRLLCDKALGDPLLAEEMVLELGCNAGYFDGGETSAALTPEGAEELRAWRFRREQLIRRRLQRAPLAVRRALGLSSLQGLRFLVSLTEAVGEAQGFDDTAQGAREAERPHAFITRSGHAAAEFARKVYRDLAEGDLENTRVEVAAARDYLRQALRRFLEEDATPSEWTSEDRETAYGLAASLLSDEAPVLAQWARAALAEILVRRYAYLAAGAVAEQALAAEGLDSLDFDALWHLQRAANLGGYPKAVEAIARRMLVVAREAPSETPEARRQLSVALSHFGDTETLLRGVVAGLGHYRDSLELSRALSAELGTPEARRDLSVSLDRVGNALSAVEGSAAGLGHYRESLEISRALSAELATLAARRDLSVSLDRVGDALSAVEGAAAGLGHYRESLEVRRALSAELATPEARRDLSVSLNKVGDALSAVEGAAAGLGHYRESLELSRALSAELATPEARRDLSVSLNKVGDALSAVEGAAAGLGHYRESLELRRALSAELATPEARRDLSVSLNKVGDALSAVEGAAAGLGHYRESLEISRALSAELATPEARRDLSVSLSKVGDALSAVEGAAAGLGHYRESLELSRALSAELATPEARRDLSVSLEKVGDALSAVEGAAAGLGHYRESLELSRALSAELGTPGARRDLAVSCHKLLKVYVEEGRVEEATGCAREGLAALEPIAGIGDADELIAYFRRRLAELGGEDPTDQD